jgi:CRP/FNR family transcriptional regulator
MGSINAISMTYSHLEPVKGHEMVSEATRTLQNMLSRLLAHATLLGRKTAPEKVATALLDLASRFPRKSNCARNEEVFNLFLTRADLADWLGLTLETVSRCINAFKRERLVAFDQPEIVTLLEREILSDIAAGRS